MTTPRPLRRWTVALLAPLALLALLAPAHARAASNQASIMMDDDNVVYRNDATRDATLRQMKALGADYVRVTVLWSVVANGAQAYAHQHHHTFNPANPASYPPRNWNRYDGIVESAKRFGIGVYFDLTGPGPAYAHARAPRSLRADLANTWMPGARQFSKFVTAVGRRYSGSFRAHGIVLPRVSVWSLWNEPNQGGWITPQYRRVGGQLLPYSPIIYRRLFIFGRSALQGSGHGGDSILIGETAPNGVARRDYTSAMDPKTFIRELFCMSPAGTPYTGAAAAARHCQDFARNPVLYATAWAHHPYTKFDSPTTRDANPNAITMANIGELPALLDQIATLTHHIRPGLPIISSEFGYETNPPDPFFGIGQDKQAAWINQGDLLAYENPRVQGQTQFLLKDAAPLRQFHRGSRQYWGTYQSGLEYLGGTPKPSLAAYELPFAVLPGPPGAIGIWGQLRFLDNTAPAPGLSRVQLEFHSGSAPANGWAAVGPPLAVTDTYKHFVTGLVAIPGPGLLRLHWSAGGVVPDHFSRSVAITATGVSALS